MSKHPSTKRLSRTTQFSPTPTTARRRAPEWIGPLVGAALAVLIGLLYFRNSLSVPIIHDAFGYYRIARQIWATGLFSPFELMNMRTWGYPTFLGGLLTFADLTRLSERGCVFVVQLALHVAAAFALLRAMQRLALPPWAVRCMFYAVLLHPFALIYPAYMLTESISLSLGTGVLACSLWLLSGPRHPLLAAGLNGVLCGYMIAVRPGSIFILPVLLLALAGATMLGRLSRSCQLVMVAVSIAGLALPLLPQVRNNLVYYGRATPLVAKPLATEQAFAGIRWIKYATSVEPNRNPQIPYLNPWATNEPLAETDPAGWYLRHPGRGALTLALHVFDLLDQDLPLPYNRTLIPGYYPFVSIANLAAVALGLIGIGVAAASWKQRTTVERWAIAMAGTILAAHLGLHSVFSVEARYGVAALLLLYGSAAICGGWLVRTASNRARLRAGLFVLAFCFLGGWLSSWVQGQSPAIREERGMVRQSATFSDLLAGGVPRLVLVETQRLRGRRGEEGER